MLNVYIADHSSSDESDGQDDFLDEDVFIATCTTDSPVDTTTDDTTDNLLKTARDNPVNDITDNLVNTTTDYPLNNTTDTDNPLNTTTDYRLNNTTDTDNPLNTTTDYHLNNTTDTDNPLNTTTDYPLNNTTDTYNPLNTTTDYRLNNTTDTDNPLNTTTDYRLNNTTDRDNPLNTTTDYRLNNNTDRDNPLNTTTDYPVNATEDYLLNTTANNFGLESKKLPSYIRDVAVLNDSPKETNEPVTFVVLIHASATTFMIQFDFGDGETYNQTVTACSETYSHPELPSWFYSAFDELDTWDNIDGSNWYLHIFQHNYTSFSVFEASVTVENVTSMADVHIQETSCALPELTIAGGGTSEEAPLEIHPFESLQLYGKLESSCVLSDKVNFKVDVDVSNSMYSRIYFERLSCWYWVVSITTGVFDYRFNYIEI